MREIGARSALELPVRRVAPDRIWRREGAQESRVLGKPDRGAESIPGVVAAHAARQVVDDLEAVEALPGAALAGRTEPPVRTVRARAQDGRIVLAGADWIS